MFTIKEVKPIIYKRKVIYNDWRDWFIKENIEIKAHETLIKLYFDEHFIYEMMMPINTRRLHFDINLQVDEDIHINNARYFIPEMCFLKNIKINKSFFSSDYLTFSSEIEFFEF